MPDDETPEPVIAAVEIVAARVKCVEVTIAIDGAIVGTHDLWLDDEDATDG